MEGKGLGARGWGLAEGLGIGDWGLEEGLEARGWGLESSALATSHWPLATLSPLFSTLAVSLPTAKYPPAAESTSYRTGPWRTTLAPVS